MENPDKNAPVDNQDFERGLADAMRDGMAEGQNGDTVNQIPAAAQTNVTALDVDPQRKGDTREGADDPSQTPEVKRDLADVTPAPAPVDKPTPNVGHDPDLQQPSGDELDASKRARDDGKKGDGPADKALDAEPVNAPNASEAAPAQDANDAPANPEVMPDTAAETSVASDAPTSFDPTTPIPEEQPDRIASLNAAGLGEQSVRETPDVSEKLKATDEAAAEAKPETPTGPDALGRPVNLGLSGQTDFSPPKDEIVKAEPVAGTQVTVGGIGQMSPTDPASAQYPSTDDRRTTDASPTESTTGSVAGGAFRAKYRALTDAEKDLIDRVKVKAEEMYALIAEAGGTDPTSDRTGSASLTLAFRHLEDCTYRTVKHITA